MMRPGLTAGALGPTKVSLNTNKSGPVCLLQQDLVQSCLRGGGILERERVLFIGTQFSILYTSMYSPAEAAMDMCYERRRAEACVD